MKSQKGNKHHGRMGMGKRAECPFACPILQQTWHEKREGKASIFARN